MYSLPSLSSLIRTVKSTSAVPKSFKIIEPPKQKLTATNSNKTCHLSLEQSNQHQQSPKASTASSHNSEKDSDTNIPRITELPKLKLTATNSNETSSDSENECTDNYENLKQKYLSKEIASNAENLSLSLRSQQSILSKKTSIVNKEPKKDMIMP